jgi:DNA-binding beta-propeller fold protein YncE
VTQYSSAGVQNTAGTITAAINTPEALAVDGLDNIWVNDGYLEVTIYSANIYPAPTGPATYMQTFVPPSNAPVYGLATHKQFIAWGSVNAFSVQYVDQILGSIAAINWSGPASEALALAFDSTGNLYIANANNMVYYGIFAAGEGFLFASLPFGPAGIAVDSARGRVYISNQQGNAIAVYSTSSGALLKTIE